MRYHWYSASGIETYETNKTAAAEIGAKTFASVDSITAAAEVATGTEEDAAKAELPDKVSGTALDGTTLTDIGITWAITSYDGDTAGTYNATATLATGYELADGVAAITGTVEVKSGP